MPASQYAYRGRNSGVFFRENLDRTLQIAGSARPLPHPATPAPATLCRLSAGVECNSVMSALQKAAPADRLSPCPANTGAQQEAGRIAMYDVGAEIVVTDRMQTAYSYVIEAAAGDDFAPGFQPYFTPKKMLEMGVFEGRYCNDCRPELPDDWFDNARVAERADPSVNYFGVKSRQSLAVWREKGWVVGPDPRGWFQWYCRYYLGRRLAEIDRLQIGRWRSFARHAAQVRRNCMPSDVSCRPRQRQALLQWSYDPLI